TPRRAARDVTLWHQPSRIWSAARFRNRRPVEGRRMLGPPSRRLPGRRRRTRRTRAGVPADDGVTASGRRGEAMVPPETRYARSGDVHIAYQVVGEGPLDLVLVPPWVTNLDAWWEEPSFARFLHRLAAFSRLIRLDKRGTGLSDRVSAVPTMEQRMDDVRAVLDAAGSERAALLGISEGGPMSVLFAATYPERTRALVLYGTVAKGTASPDYPWGDTPEQLEAWYAAVPQLWGGPVGLDV